MNTWLALAIGNSRLHWALFQGQTLQQTWHTPHLNAAMQHQLATAWQFGAVFPEAPLASDASRFRIPDLPPNLPLLIASVVPTQSRLWQTYAHVHFLSLVDVPLGNLYPSLGLDRALALWGAIATVGSPVLVIDAGTALTFTGGASPSTGAPPQLVGGAILPGLRLQLQALGQSTAALPALALEHLGLDPVGALPPRWARSTADAIASGILFTLLASLRSFIEDWWQQFPESAVVLTGGDAALLQTGCQIEAPDWRDRLILAPDLIFTGMAAMGERVQ